MDRVALREEAKKLRRRGKTYPEIMEILDIKLPKSTMAEWCRGTSLPDWYWKKINRINKSNLEKAQRAAWLVNKEKTGKLVRELENRNKKIVKKLKDKDTLKMILAMLFLGEGSKWKTHHGLMLGSSDPTIMFLYTKLLELCYGIKKESLKCRISYRADQNINVLERYWSRLLGIPLSNFYKTIPDPRTVGKPTKKKDYMGVCVITCAGTPLQLELEAIPRLILKGL